MDDSIPVVIDDRGVPVENERCAQIMHSRGHFRINDISSVT